MTSWSTVFASGLPVKYAERSAIPLALMYIKFPQPSVRIDSGGGPRVLRIQTLASEKLRREQSKLFFRLTNTQAPFVIEIKPHNECPAN